MIKGIIELLKQKFKTTLLKSQHVRTQIPVEITGYFQWRSKMTHIRITNEVVETAVGVEGTSTKLPRSRIEPILIFSDLIRSGLVLGLGAAEGVRFGGKIFFQGSSMSINLSRDVPIYITSGGNGIFRYLFGNLKITLIFRI